MLDIIKLAVSQGAKIYGSVSGGKDGQAMVATLINNGLQIAALVHADLGRVEWPQSHGMCERQSIEFGITLNIVRRYDGRDMLAHWQHRMEKLMGTGKPFWSSSSQRYCTSDLKRDPINRFFRNCGHDFIISAEGIRAQESTARAKKIPLDIRWEITSSHYAGMTVEEAIQAFTPGKRLALTWYPIFNFSIDDVWGTYGMTQEKLQEARAQYKSTNQVPAWWPFHDAYAFGNDRVSCMFCVLGSLNDLTVGAKHNPELLDQMIQMEDQGCATFKNKWSLKSLKTA